MHGPVKPVHHVPGLAAPKHGDHLTVVRVDDGDPGLHLIALEGNRVVSGVVQFFLGPQV